MLTISLFGPPQVKVGEELITNFVTNKARALLYYLVVNKRPCTRDELATLLWGNLGEARAKNNLRRILPNLRKLVGPYLSINRQTIGLAPQSPYWLDTEQFTSVLTRFQRAVPGTALDLAEVEQAIHLYQGDFLDGFYLDGAPAYEEWSLFQREYLRELAVNSLHLLVEHYMRAQEYAGALAATNQLLFLEPWRETAHQQRMILLHSTGQRIAALEQYETCRTVLAAEFGLEPLAETRALYEEIRAEVMKQNLSPISNTQPQQVAPTWAPPHPLPANTTINWSEIPRLTTFYGRDQELAQLSQWLQNDRCSLIAIVGIGGTGKTSLAAQLIQRLFGKDEPRLFGKDEPRLFGKDEPRLFGKDEPHPYDFVLWGSLINAPKLESVLGGWLQLMNVQHAPLQEGALTLLAELQERLFELLRQRRCLLVFDNLESILQKGAHAGAYSEGYEAYGQFMQRMAQTTHQSCLLITSREEPVGFSLLVGDYADVQTLNLAGLSPDAGRELLTARVLNGSPAQMALLVEQYGGNPLALKLVAEAIQELHAGNVEPFLKDETVIFGHIRDVLEQQFARLVELERALLFWLAIEREPIPLNSLWEDLLRKPSRAAFADALRSLRRRSMVEEAVGKRWGLQNVMMEFITERLLHLLELDFVSDESPLLTNYALLRSNASEHICAAQYRLLLQPLARCLLSRFGPYELSRRIDQKLVWLRTAPSATGGYLAANLFHLLVAANLDMAGRDFSKLPLWKADLRGLRLHNVNFSGADLSGSAFTETFGDILAVAFSPNSQLLAASTTSGNIHFWRVSDGRTVGVCRGNGRWLWSLAFSPDGNLLASGSADRTIRLWNVASMYAAGQDALSEGRLYGTLTGHTDAIFALAFDGGGQLLASGSADHTVRLWDLQQMQAVQLFEGHSGTVYTLAWGRLPPDETPILVSAGGDHAIRIWCLASGRCLNVLTDHSDVVTSLVLHPSSQDDAWEMITASLDRTIRIWSIRRGQCIRVLPQHNPELWALAASPCGALAASADEHFAIRLWHIEQADVGQKLIGHTAMVRALAFSADGKLLASGGEEQRVRIWRVDEKGGRAQALHTLQGYRNEIDALAIGPDGQTLLTGNTDASIHLWRLNDLQEWRQADVLQSDRTGARSGSEPVRAMGAHSAARDISCLNFHPDGTRFVSANVAGMLALWQLKETGAVQISVLHDHPSPIYAALFNPTGSLLAFAGAEQSIHLWSVEHQQPLCVLRGHTHPVHVLAFHPTQPFLLSGGDSELFVWDITSVERGGASELARKSALSLTSTNTITALAFSPDGRILAGGGVAGLIQLWSFPNFTDLGVLAKHKSTIFDLAFSADGETLASASGDQSINLWTLANKRRQADGAVLPSFAFKQTLRGHGGPVSALVFHPQGTGNAPLLSSSSADETIRVWNVESGECAQVIRPAGPYAGMQISEVTGITLSQRVVLKSLGAVD